MKKSWLQLSGGVVGIGSAGDVAAAELEAGGGISRSHRPNVPGTA
ncbi:hypothetical protein OFL98_25555 [Escherichia coli]|nr:hypothetical protein [Escherichia coli]